MVEVNGKKIRGRQYPWGVVEARMAITRHNHYFCGLANTRWKSHRFLFSVVQVENPRHCDFIKLRTMLITHMQDLQEVTHDVHYENFRSQKLRTSNGAAEVVATPARRVLDDKDKQLQEKEAELRRMQEMLASMQQQIKQQSHTSLQSVEQ